MLPGDHPEQRRLSRSIATDEPDPCAGGDLRGGLLEHEAAADADGQIVKGQHDAF
jgi:hypothetical protein